MNTDLPHLPELPPTLEDYYGVFQDELSRFPEQARISLLTRFRAVNELMVLSNIIEREVVKLFEESGVTGP